MHFPFTKSSLASFIHFSKSMCFFIFPKLLLEYRGMVVVDFSKDTALDCIHYTILEEENSSCGVSPPLLTKLKHRHGHTVIYGYMVKEVTLLLFRQISTIACS